MSTKPALPDDLLSDEGVRRSVTAAGSAPRVLVLRLEPAGYMVDLVRALRSTWPGPVDVVYVSTSMTQDWGTEFARDDVTVLPRGVLTSVLALRRYIAATSPRLIHAAGWGAPQSAAAILIGSIRGLPVVVDLDTWHGATDRWRTAAKSFILPRMFKHVTHFAPGGRPQVRYLRRYGVPEDRITPVNMTVDVTGIRQRLATGGADARAAFRAQFGIPSDAVVVLCVARMVAEKGIGTLIAAWTLLCERFPGAHLVLVGDGEMRDRADAAAKRIARIHVAGRLPADQVWRAYAAADILVGPSHREPWGLVVNEAMAADLPVVVTEAYGCAADLVREGGTGLVVPTGDVGALAGALARLIDDGTLRGDMAAEARALISGWTIEKQAERIVGIWSRVLRADTSAGSAA